MATPTHRALRVRDTLVEAALEAGLPGSGHGGLVRDLAGVALPRLSTPPVAAPAETDDLIGAVVAGRYAIERVVGRGGMGVVYEARHAKLGHPFAVKVLDVPVLEPWLVEAFEREAVAACRLDHPSIVRVFDLGQIEDGRPFMAMELLRGDVLDSYLARSGPVRAPQVAALLWGVASALDLAHAGGILHRDIKPGNLFLARRSDGNVDVKLLDFGVARFHDHGEKDAGRITGTPQYMAPEVLSARSSDHRADVYALGVVTYELLTGRVPFDGPRVRDVVEAVVSATLPSMSSWGIPFAAEVEAVVARCLARDPTQRHPTSGAFLRDLRAAVQGRAVHPATARRAGLPCAAAPPPSRRAPGPPVIMVVDLDRHFRERLGAAVTAMGWRALEASSARDAARLLSREHVDAAVVEGLLPDATGVELVDRIRAHGATFPIVFVTRFWGGDAARHVLDDLAILGPLEKSWSMAGVMELLQKSLDVGAASDSRTDSGAA